jgi:predicted AAA+ superfamily ATPase
MANDMIYFKRKVYDSMLKWKEERNGNTALLIQGARRIGKSTIAEEFARREYKSYILIDFSKASKEVIDLFNDISDLNFLFLRLQFIYRRQLYERESVIIFDEVQLQPLARQAIKHLVKDNRYDYIETGSLISVRSKSRT